MDTRHIRDDFELEILKAEEFTKNYDIMSLLKTFKVKGINYG